MKKIKAGTLESERQRLFEELMEMRSGEHTGGRRRAHDNDAASPTMRYRYDDDEDLVR